MNSYQDCVEPISGSARRSGAQVKPCFILDLGRRDYESSLAIQNGVVERRKKKEIADCLLFVEYPHLITLGRSGGIQHLLVSKLALEERGVGFFFTDRGGDITYHGPGQLIAYPVIDLKEWRRDVGYYLRSLEDCLIDTLADFGIPARSIPGTTGVWVEEEKIAAIGIRTSQWVTSHGLSLNVFSDLSFFDLIVPCGLKSRRVTSMLEILGTAVSISTVKARFCVHFSRAFERTLEPVLSCH